MHLTTRATTRWVFLASLLAATETAAYSLATSSPGKWGDPSLGAGATLSYSFMGPGLDTVNGTSVALSSFLPSGFEQDVSSAFDAWSAVANLTFVEKPDPNVDYRGLGADTVDIRISGVIPATSEILGSSFFPPVYGGAGAGDIQLSSTANWRLSSASGPGISVYLVAVHEIGHTLGLQHPGCGNPPACPDLGPYVGDPISSRLMSPVYNASLAGPQRDDIAGIQYLYGAALTAEPVPLPASVLLFPSAVGGWLVAGRRARRPRRGR